MKRTGKILILILAFLLLAGAVWYHIPIRRRVDMTLCSRTGETLRLEGTLSLQRYFFRPTALRAEVTIDGIPYVDETTKLGSFTETPTLWENLRGKWQGQITDRFLYPRDLPPMEALSYRFSLNFPPGRTDLSCLSLLDAKNSVFYYGPAETAEEAQTLEPQFLSDHE